VHEHGRHATEQVSVWGAGEAEDAAHAKVALLEVMSVMVADDAGEPYHSEGTGTRGGPRTA
jgi:hypothetical protein